MLTHIALAIALASPVGPPKGDSTRTDRDVRLAALRHVADVRRCYEREGLTRDPRLAGTMDVTVTILATGVVRDAAVTAHAMRGVGAREVAACLTATIRNWRFERGPFAVETIIFPFSFAPDDAPPPKVVAGDQVRTPGRHRRGTPISGKHHRAGPEGTTMTRMTRKPPDGSAVG